MTASIKPLLCSLFFSAMFLAIPGKPAHAEESTVRIGLILPLSGSAQSWGAHMSNAAKLALSEQALETRERLALYFEDDQLNAAKAVSAFRKLTEGNDIQIGIVFGGQSVAAVSPLAEQRKIPIFVLTANASLVEGKEYSFRHWPDAALQVAALAPLLKERQLRRIAIPVVTHEAMLDYANRIEKTAATLGIATVFREEFTVGDTDFKTALLRIFQAKADAIVMALLPPQMSAFMKQLSAAKLDVPVFGFSNTETASEVEAAQGSMEGIIYTAPNLNPAFVQTYVNRFSDYPELSAPNVYDMIKIIAEGVEDGAVSSEALRQHISTLSDFEGALGTYSVTPKRDFTFGVVLKTIKDGRFTALER